MKRMRELLSYKEYLEKDIMPNLDKIQEERIKGGTFQSVSQMLGVPLKSLHDIITRYAYIDNFNLFLKDNENKLTNEEKDIEKEKQSQINRAWVVDDIRVSMVEDALFKSCFDHKEKYKVAMKVKNGFYTDGKKDEEEEKIVYAENEQVIPASYNAQRYFLINRCANKWSNENKDSIAPITDKISSIKVEWKESEKDEKQQERVDKIEKDL